MQPSEWNPVAELEAIQRRLNRAMGERWVQGAHRCGGFTPSVDIQETDAEFIVKADLPDVKRDGLKIHVQDAVVAIEGERSNDREGTGTRFYKAEREYGRFVRRLELPMAVESGKVSAEFKDGVLKVVLPKAAARRRH